MATAAVALAGLAIGLHKLDDFDTWWHLAAGRWIATHHAVPVTDTLSHTVRDHAWVNMQWLFDLALYGAHQMVGDRKSTRLNSSHVSESRMPSSA